MTDKNPQNCPICDSVLLEHVGPYINNEYPRFKPFQNLENYACPQCGYGASLPQLTVDDMKSFYVSDFRAEGSPHSHAGSKPLKSKNEPAPRALSHWMLLLMFRSFHKNSTFCDIGAGGDSTFQVARFLGLDLQNFAYEPDIPVQNLLRKEGICIVDSTVGSSMKLPPKKMDGIIMSHVLEHFCRSEVVPILKRVCEMLSNDGVFVCEVPHVPLLSLKGTRPNDAPHLSFWTVTSLKTAAIKAGLQPVFIATAGKSYSIWAKSHFAQKPNPIKNKIKKIIPSSMIAAARRTQSFLNEAKEGLRRATSTPNVYDIIGSPHFQYRDDGIFLRMVCRKKLAS